MTDQKLDPRIHQTEITRRIFTSREPDLPKEDFYFDPDYWGKGIGAYIESDHSLNKRVQKKFSVNKKSDLDRWLERPREDKHYRIENAGKSLGMAPDDIQAVKENLDLLDAFLKKAFHVKQKGRTRFAARTIVEVLRWNSQIEDSSKDFKISNNITPRLSEISMELFTELDGLFRKHSR